MSNERILTNNVIGRKLSTGMHWLSGLLGRLFKGLCIKLRLCKGKSCNTSQPAEKKADKWQKGGPSPNPKGRPKSSKNQKKAALLETLLTCESEHLRNAPAKTTLQSEVEYLSCVIKKARALIATPEEPEPLKISSAEELATTIKKIKQGVVTGELSQQEADLIINFFERCSRLLEWAGRWKRERKQS